jgi:hypothetical protein
MIFLSIVRDAIRKVSAEHLSDSRIEAILKDFDTESKLTVAEDMPAQEYVEQTRAFPNLQKAAKHLSRKKSPAISASAIEFLLESLHLKGKLNKEEIGTTSLYRR